VGQVLQQNTQLADEISEAYQTPSEKPKKDPIMALVTKTLATYMFIKHNNGSKRDPGTEDFSSWGNHFSKRRSEDDDRSKSNDSKSESESESKNTKRKSENKDIITIRTKSKTINIKRPQHKATAKADKVKAIKRTKNKIKTKPERQLDKIRKYQELTPQTSQSSFHLHLATSFIISILIFNYLLSDHLDHPF
jgi:hypothetical protein